MSKIKAIIERTGNWVGEAIAILNDLPVEDKFNALSFTLTELEAYTKERKRKMRDEIMAVFNSKLQWLETGEDVVFDDDFVFHYLCTGYTLTKLKKDIKAIGLYTALFEEVHYKMVVKPEFIDYNKLS
jgi:hypothetical protein